jgi:DNA-binding transcriptional LysR family regulator
VVFNRCVAVDLQRLKYFIAVAEERHITRAAARLGMAQPPLSQQIRVLEAEMGTKLFERLPKGVSLTPAGEALLEDARFILDAADRAGRRVRRIACGEDGELVGGITTSAALHPFVPYTTEIRKFLMTCMRTMLLKSPTPFWRIAWHSASFALL